MATCSRPKTRSEAKELDADKAFPPSKHFNPPTKLPTLQSVISMLRYHLEVEGIGKVTTDMAVSEVAKQVYAKYYHDTVYCVSLSTIKRRVEALRKQFTEGRKRYGQKGKENSKAVNDYKELFERKGQLFDVYLEDPVRRQALQEEWGVSMSDMEHKYYEDQKTERKMYCHKGVDPVWYQSTMRAQRVRERQEEYRKERDQQFQYRTLDEITANLIEAGEIFSSTASSGGEEPEESEPKQKRQKTSETDKHHKEGELSDNPKGKKRKIFTAVAEMEVDDPLPPAFQHIRESERKIREDFYKTVANLSGKGLSISEASSAVIEVGNTMFGRRWKSPGEYDEIFDVDTVPTNKNIREALQQIEAQSLSLVVDKLDEEKQKGRMITHASDSTTKKGVGQFMVQGLHVGQETPFPLPILPIHGETTEDIAMQVDMGFEILASVRGVSAEDVYKLVDTHMTDSTEHNKGFANLLAEMYDIEKPAGQLFCGTHTTLGFSSAMNKVMKIVEADMKMEQVLKGFMVDMEVESKNTSLAGQSLDMCLKLVAPEYSHKPWNRYKPFLLFLEQRNVSNVLFAYKDNRFGCLSRAAAVLIHIYDHLVEFLRQNPHINNRLACLVREVLELPYLKVVLVVFACLGVHLVEPFYARTIEKGATHTQLSEFYKGLHTGLGKPISDDFTRFIKPEYTAVSDDLFAGVKKSYTEEVLSSVSDVAEEHMEEVKKLTNLMLPHMQTVLARQRRDYGIDEESFPMDYPVSDQASNIDETPVHNIGMERQCGKVDHRLKKLGTLNAVSRSIILQKSQELRHGQVPSFRGFKAAVQAKREVELNWSRHTQEKFEMGAAQKQEMAQRNERKRLDMLDKLKASGGPFTDSSEVEQFIASEKLNDKEKQQRMKLEVQFARESTTLLPKVDPIFRIQVTLPSGKRRTKTAQEFGEALMSFLGKKSDRTTLDYDKFKESLNKIASL
uniref:Uncharacterized protein n=1 Tax=Branchiostoma floridae TaxID=7739 RepID=C3YJB7_BRAFL|eukprot:XP_002603604.1 hypothetical protein BRAFLDRAFT_93148 [Branchiostoma floridae]